jgi:hypothetical protein
VKEETKQQTIEGRLDKKKSYERSSAGRVYSAAAAAAAKQGPRSQEFFFFLSSKKFCEKAIIKAPSCLLLLV